MGINFETTKKGYVVGILKGNNISNYNEMLKCVLLKNCKFGDDTKTYGR